MRSPLLDEPGAATPYDESPDAGVPWHFGDPFRESRAAERSAVVVDRSHRFVATITGPERLTWLHTISSQHIANLRDGEGAEDLSLDLNGRIEHHFVLTDLDGTLWLDTEAERGPALLDFLSKMVFWSKVETRAAPDHAVLSLIGPTTPQLLTELGATVPAAPYAATALPGGPELSDSGLQGGFVRRMPWPAEQSFDLVIPRAALAATWRALTAAGATPAGSWTFEALRVAALRPRIGVDTDERTIPHEVGLIGGPGEFGAVHLDKGCYRGQETVARVHNLGKPPRRLVLLHIDGSADARPVPGDDVLAGARSVGRVGTVIDHHDDGPIALALVKRAVPADAELTAAGAAVSIDPESITDDDRVQAGRAAIDRLRGR
ncbi:folate-binding protein [Rhodococcus rhodnii]|uniref:Folate-binding protein n=1 Tax=Rhodococcus rhodnii TaxID=38312 RepID=A0A6P2CHK2_9NOCA|nr:folate-binding protein YgfZ [Rhodococcus rhodnii]TXG92277.1 folate-binding protein [Rhodococcus rhodnii]